MVGKVKFDIKGGRELEALLKDLGPKIASRIGDKALRAGARPIVKEAKRIVRRQTGDLRRSIVAVIGSRRRPNERLVQIGVRKPHSRRFHLLEYGTVHSRAFPFMRPALDSQARAAFDAMAETMATAILRQEWRQTLSLLAEGTEIDFGE